MADKDEYREVAKQLAKQINEETVIEETKARKKRRRHHKVNHFQVNKQEDNEK